MLGDMKTRRKLKIIEISLVTMLQCGLQRADRGRCAQYCQHELTQTNDNNIVFAAGLINRIEVKHRHSRAHPSARLDARR